MFVHLGSPVLVTWHYLLVPSGSATVHVLPLVPKGNITLKYIEQLTSSGLWDHSGNLFGLTLEYVHADGAECLLLAL